MRTNILGIALIIIGIIMIAYTGFNWVTTETVVDLGPLQVEAEKNNYITLSPIIGGLLLIAGIFFVFTHKKKIG
jgi:uncharacterized membrane protein YidH (DUF202 family)